VTASYLGQGRAVPQDNVADVNDHPQRHDEHSVYTAQRHGQVASGNMRQALFTQSGCVTTELQNCYSPFLHSDQITLA
jgi:hypothetical protein